MEARSGFCAPVHLRCTLQPSVLEFLGCRIYRVLGFTLKVSQALAPATTVDAEGGRVPAMLVRLQREEPSGAALLAANARLHWGSGSGAHEPAHRRAADSRQHHHGKTHAICPKNLREGASAGLAAGFGS